MDIVAIINDMAGTLTRLLGSDMDLAVDVEQALPEVCLRPCPAHDDPATCMEAVLMLLTADFRDMMSSGTTLTLKAKRPQLNAHQGRLGPGDYVMLTLACDQRCANDHVVEDTLRHWSVAHGLAIHIGVSVFCSRDHQGNTEVDLYLPSFTTATLGSLPQVDAAKASLHVAPAPTRPAAERGSSACRDDERCRCRAPE